MEFYLCEKPSIASFAKRFNSQRDGILRLPDGDRDRLPQVSIPNGMEFYLKLAYA